MTDSNKSFTWKDFYNNLFENNAIFVQILGMCPVLAITTSISNGFGLGMAVIFVMLCSNIVVSMIRNFVPRKIRIPSFIVVIATFVTMTDLIMKGYFPESSKSLGIFIPLIVSNCLPLARVEAFASKRSVFASTLDAFGTGIGYTLALMLLGGIRELLGTGKIVLMNNVLVSTGMPINYMILAPGAFLAFGLTLGFFRYISLRRQKSGKVEFKNGCSECGVMENLLVIAISALLVNNYVLARFLGICSYLGVSQKTSSAVGMGLAVTFVTTASAFFAWLVDTFVLVKYDIAYLQIVIFIFIIASFVQLTEIVSRKYFPALYNALGIYLPLITTNCVLLGALLINVKENYGFMAAVWNGFFAGAGSLLALFLMSGIRERLDLCNIPEAMKGLPIALVAASLTALAFVAFNGLIPAG